MGMEKEIIVYEFWVKKMSVVGDDYIKCINLERW